MKKRKKRSPAEKWLRRRERKIDRLRWRHRWFQWLKSTDRLRWKHRALVDEERKVKKRLAADEMAREVLKSLNFHKGSNILLLEGSPVMKEELVKMPASEVYFGLAGDRRSFGTYDYVVFGTVTNPLRIIEVYMAQHLIDGNGRKKFLKSGSNPTRLAAMVNRAAVECGYKLPTDEWMSFTQWLDKHHARTYDLHGHPKKMIVVIDRETP